MSTEEHRSALRMMKALRRQHKLSKAEVDALPWPHPRPSSDPRLIAIHLALVWTAVVQVVFGASGSSMVGRTFDGDWVLTWMFCGIIAACCGLYLTAAYCKSQYESFGYESGACVGFVGMMGIYTFQQVTTAEDWWKAQLTPLIIALLLGNAVRAFVLIRRLW